MNKKLIKSINDNKSLNIFGLMINFILFLIPPILGLLWLYNKKMNKCECSEGKFKNIKNYVKYYFIFIISYCFFMLLYVIFFSKKFKNLIISILLFVYNYISYAIIIYYIYNLKEIKCQCSESLNRDIIYIWYIILIIFSTIILPAFFIVVYNLIK